MKSVLISIQPKWCELISSGKKTVEVRKTVPKEVPFKVYIYQTKKRWIYKLLPWFKERQAKVIGEFICDEIICCQAYYGASGLKHLTNIFDNELQQTCLTEYELFDYIVGKNKFGTGWLWHISELKIYDEPTELSEFVTRKGVYNGLCGKVYKPIQIIRPPQSWCYVEEQL